MRVRPAAGGRNHAVSLARSEYETLLDAADTDRRRLLVRLGGEAGLRAAEMARIRAADRRRPDADREGAFLAVPTDGGEGHDREAYLPAALDRELTRYVDDNAIAEAEPVVDLSTRRVEMLIREVAEGAADRTGIEAFRYVSAHDLRRHFARTLLDRGVDPRIVREVGGWESFDALRPYLNDPTDAEVAAAIESPPRTPAFDALDETLVEASTRADLEREACGALAGDPSYAFAWIEGVDGARPNATAGADPDALSSLRERVPTGLDGPASLSAPSIDRVEAVAAVPVAGGSRYGTLGVASTRAIPPGERDRLATLGRRIGHAITAIRRRDLLFGDAVVELEFRSTDPDAFLIAASDRYDCRLSLESIVSGSDSTLLFYLTVGDALGDVFDLAAKYDGIEGWRLIEEHGAGGLVEFAVTGASPMAVLTGYGVAITEATFDRGTARILADCAADTDIRTLVDGLRGSFPDSELVGKQAATRPPRTVEGFRRSVSERLTDRQRAALRAAYFSGYFDWPRDSTAEEVADAMGVSSPTLHNHLRKGQHELLSVLFED